MFMLAREALSPAAAPGGAAVARLYTGTESADHGGGGSDADDSGAARGTAFEPERLGTRILGGARSAPAPVAVRAERVPGRSAAGAAPETAPAPNTRADEDISRGERALARAGVGPGTMMTRDFETSGVIRFSPDPMSDSPIATNKRRNKNTRELLKKGRREDD